MSRRTTHTRGPLLYNDPASGAGLPAGRRGLHAGLPVGITLLSDYLTHYIDYRSDVDLPTNGTDGLTITESAVGAVALSDDTMPFLRVTTNAGDDSISNYQWTNADGAGEYYLLVDTETPTTDSPNIILPPRRIYFETMFRLGDAVRDALSVTQTEFFIGLAITDTDIISGCTDFIGFYKQDVTDTAGNNVRFVAGQNASGTGDLEDGIDVNTGIVLDAATDAMDTDDTDNVAGGTWVRLAFEMVGTQVCYVYAGEKTWDDAGAKTATNRRAPRMNHVRTVNSDSVTGYGTDPINFPADEELCLSFELKSGEAVAKSVDIAYILTAIER